jgi:glycosyltransferase involved in cell wall biosynthesis
LHGVPVVASAVGEQASYGAHGAAQLVPATASAADFASATASLLRTPVAQREMISRARRHLRANYQWRDLAASLADFYAHILAGR